MGKVIGPHEVTYTHRGNFVVFVMQLLATIIPNMNIPNTTKMEPKINKRQNVEKDIRSFSIDWVKTTGVRSSTGPSLLSSESFIKHSPGKTTINVAAKAPRKEITTSMPGMNKANATEVTNQTVA